MTSNHYAQKLTLGIPGLERYLIDSRGGLWKHQGRKSGADKPVTAIGFAACMRRLGRKYSSFNMSPWPLLPGVWLMLHVTDLPEAMTYVAHLPIDQVFKTYCFGSARQHLPGWPNWNAEIHQAVAEVDGEGCDLWYCLSDYKSELIAPDPMPRPVAILGPVAFLAASLKITACTPRDNRYNRER
jgi:hypothetical protein